MGHSLESLLDIRLKTRGNVTREEAGNTSLGALTEETVRVNTGKNVFTNRDGGKTTRGDLAERDKAVRAPALQPSLESTGQFTGQTALTATTEEGLESALDFTRQTGDKTATTSEVQRRLDLGSKTGLAGSLEERVQGVLELRGKDLLATNVGGAQDTLEGNDETTLTSNTGGRRAQNRETARNIAGQKTVITTSSPVEEGLAEVTFEVTTVLTTQKRGELLTSSGANRTSLNTQCSTLESGSTLRADATENVGGALGTTTEETREKTAQVEAQVDINVEAKAAAVGSAVGRVGESTARQTGEHKKVVGTHSARFL